MRNDEDTYGTSDEFNEHPEFPYSPDSRIWSPLFCRNSESRLKAHEEKGLLDVQGLSSGARIVRGYALYIRVHDADCVRQCLRPGNDHHVRSGQARVLLASQRSLRLQHDDRDAEVLRWDG